jgi:hypothetical protein
MAMLFDFRILGQELRAERRGAVQNNPARAPKEYIDLLESISQWARAGLKKHSDVQFNSGNAKMNKSVSDPVSTNRKLIKSRGKWITQGVALMPSNQLASYFKNPDGSFDKKKLNYFSLTEADVKKFTNACPAATKGCMSVCLTDSGQMHMAPAKLAQIRRHLTYQLDRDAFMITVAVGLAKSYAMARKKGAKLGIRLNVTSDIAWEKEPIKVDPWLSKYLASYGIKAKNGRPMKPGRYKNIMEAMPQIFFYDYTKVQGRFLNFMEKRGWPKNYHLVWSLAETPMNRKIAIEALLRRVTTVSTPFDVSSRGKASLPKTLTFIDNTAPGRPEYTFPVNDADEHDMRALDDPGAIAGLKFKIPARKGGGKQAIAKAHGFVVETKGSMHPIIKVNQKKP